MTAVGIMMVRDDADVLEVNLRYHLALGLERVLVVENGSADATPRLLRRLARELAVSWTVQAGAFHQGQAFTDLARTAGARGARWIVPLDADEFWHVPGGLLALLARTRAGVLRAPHIHFVQRREQRERSPRALLGLTHRVPRPIDPVGGTDRVHRRQRSYVEVRSPPKHIMRYAPGLEIDPGNHWVEGAAGTTVRPRGLAALHAPLRCPQDLLRKAHLGQRVEERGFLPGESWHVRRWRALRDADALEGEWSANSQRDGWLDVYGRARPVVYDGRLVAAVAAWVDACHPARPGRRSPRRPAPLTGNTSGDARSQPGARR